MNDNVAGICCQMMTHWKPRPDAAQGSAIAKVSEFVRKVKS
jgi:hypothetical protein